MVSRSGLACRPPAERHLAAPSGLGALPFPAVCLPFPAVCCLTCECVCAFRLSSKCVLSHAEMHSTTRQEGFFYYQEAFGCGQGQVVHTSPAVSIRASIGLVKGVKWEPVPMNVEYFRPSASIRTICSKARRVLIGYRMSDSLAMKVTVKERCCGWVGFSVCGVVKGDTAGGQVSKAPHVLAVDCRVRGGRFPDGRAAHPKFAQPIDLTHVYDAGGGEWASCQAEREDRSFGDEGELADDE